METQQQLPSESPYQASIAMRVKRPDGVYVDLAPGDAIPAGVVESWPDPQVLFKRRHFCRFDGANLDPNVRGKYVPPRALTDEDIDRNLEPAPSRPGGSHEPVGPVDGKVSAARVITDQELDTKPANVKPASAEKIAELQSKSRRELMNLAAQSNVRVGGSESKDELVRSLLEAGQTRL
jgi:hypothetical protein